MARSLLSRATDAVAARLDRRSFLSRSALVGSALVTAPGDLLLRPTSAYAAICRCQGQSCQCGSLCCDGYTEFCCAIYGTNACPPGSLIGGWWKADGSSFCGGRARYYMDCHKPCGGCSCGGAGICSGSCNGTPCGCGRGRCDHRKAGCTSFRYGNCSNHIACVGPIQCRIVTCTEPWKIEPSCSAAAVRTDNRTGSHNRPCLQQAPPVHLVVGDWNGDGTDGIGWYDNRDATWRLREHWSGSDRASTQYGREPGDIPVTGDWDGDGTDGIGVFRKGTWHLSNNISGPVTVRSVTFGQQPGDIPVTGDWNGDGIDTIGVFRAGIWYLSDAIWGAKAHRIPAFGRHGDVPVTGDWNGDGVDSIGVFRSGRWYLSNSTTSPRIDHDLLFGQEPGDVPVVGDWTGSGRDSIGVYRPYEGRWYLREHLGDGSPVSVQYGPRWYLG